MCLRGPVMVANKEKPQWRKKVGQEIARGFGIAWFVCAHEETRVSLGIVFEGVLDHELIRIFTQDRPVDLSFVVEISLIKFAYVVLCKYVIDFLLLMDAEDLPVRINAATAGSQYELAARVSADEVCDVVNAGFANDPLTLGVPVMLDYIR